MAVNTVTAFFEKLLGAAGEYNKAKVGNLSFIDSVYKDVRSETGRAGQSIKLYFPDFGSFGDIGGGDLVDQAINPGSVEVPFVNHPAASFTTRDWEQFQTAQSIRDLFIDPMYKRALEYINGDIASLVTTANFNVNPVIFSATPSEISKRASSQAWNALVSQRVPMSDPDTLSMLMHNDVYTNMVVDPAMTSQNIVGQNIAQAAQQQGKIGDLFNFNLRWDQQAPKAAVTLAGTVAVSFGSAVVTGTGTTFTTTLAVGRNVVFSSDPTATPYRVQSIADDTHFTMTANYGGSTSAANTVQSSQYTCAAIHRNAIGVALRPMPTTPNNEMIMSQTVVIKGIPFRVIASYQHNNLGWKTSVDFGYGKAVIRPDYGTIINC